MASFTDKTPPPFDRNIDIYTKWRKKLEVWENITDVAETKKGSLIILRLDEDTQDTVLEAVSNVDLKSEQGAKKVLDQMDIIFQVDASVTAFEAYEEFESYRRLDKLSVKEYCSEFQKKYKKVENTGTKLADHVLAYRLLKSAGLNETDERLVKATIAKMTYDNMSKQLKTLFNGEVQEVSQKNPELKVKEEPVEQDTMYGGYSRYNSDRRSFNNRGRGASGYSQPEDRRWDNRRNDTEDTRWDNRRNESENEKKKPQKKRGKNPLDKYGNVTRCRECDSINHWAKNCPDSYSREQRTFLEEQQRCSDDEDQREQPDRIYVIDVASVINDTFEDLTKLTMSCDTLGIAVLDCGAPKTVCGKIWLKQYMSTLSEEDKKLMVYAKSKNIYKFGCGSKLPACSHVCFPAVIGEKKVILQADVVDGDLPLLFSKESMKSTASNLNFKDDTLEILGQKLNLEITESGHYALPLGRNRQMMTDVGRGSNMKVTFVVDNLSPQQTAVKLHRQFAHPSADRLVKLVQSQGKECEELTTAIREVTKKCSTCALYKKPPPRPVVGLPMASRFGQVVAMDLKQFGKVHLLHIIDHTTRLSAGAVIRSKTPEVIIKNIFGQWISIYGSPENILSDNGGEFNNTALRELGEKFGINIKTTAAESPWSNGLVERHNQIMGDMIKKTQADTGCSLEMAVTWCITAHNSLSNVHGFSPFQLVFGRNPILPALQSDRPPALNQETVSDMLRENLNAMHAGRQAFVRSESSEKVRRALSHNVRTTGEIRYFTGDRVYYKRKDSRKWKGPAVVLGQDGKQVLVKHGGQYVRVHPCRLSLESATIVGLGDSEVNNECLGSDAAEVKTTTEDSNAERIKTRSVTFKDSSEEAIVINEQAANNKGVVREPESRGDEDQQVVTEKKTAGEVDADAGIVAEVEVLDDGEQVNSESESEDGSEQSKQETGSDKDQKTTINSDSESEDDSEQSKQETGSDKDQKNSRGRPRKKGQITSGKEILKPGVVVRYRMDSKNVWKVTTLVRRGGKKNGVHKYCWNTVNSSGHQDIISFDKDVHEWEVVTNIVRVTEEIDCPTEMMLTPTYITHATEERQLAMIKELESWRQNKVYTEVEDMNQQCISGRWVVKPKVIEGKHSLKARFVLRGFEEEKDFRTDSPTCMRSSVRLLLVVIASFGWKLNSIDFKTAFLQGDPIDREIYMRPPKEAHTHKLWRLNKTVYGLCDAPRQWYLRLKSIIVELQCVMSTLDSGLFFMHGAEGMEGILVIFVDDVLWGGASAFESKVIAKLKASLNVGSEQSEAFRYVGILMKQEEDLSIRISQESYVDSLKPIEISEERVNQKDDNLSKVERSKLRSVMGQINWVSNISRPDIGFSAGQVNMSSSKSTVNDMIKANKLLRNIKDTQSSILFPKLDLRKAYLKVYTDASFANLADGGSQGGHVVFLTDGDRVCPLTWRSAKVKRIVKSTIAAETLALLDGLEAAYLLSKIAAEVIHNGEVESLPVVGITDNRNLSDSAYSSSLLEDKRLLIEMNIIRQMVNRNEVQLEWVKSGEQVSDVLTKIGASGTKLREVVSKGFLQ